MKIILFTLFVRLRIVEAQTCHLLLFAREADWAGNLGVAGDEEPAVDRQKTRGVFAVFQSFGGQSPFLIRPAQTGLWIPACRLTAHIHQVIFSPHCWQKQRASRLWEEEGGNHWCKSSQEPFWNHSSILVTTVHDRLISTGLSNVPHQWFKIISNWPHSVHSAPISQIPPPYSHFRCSPGLCLRGPSFHYLPTSSWPYLL